MPVDTVEVFRETGRRLNHSLERSVRNEEQEDGAKAVQRLNEKADVHLRGASGSQTTHIMSSLVAQKKISFALQPRAAKPSAQAAWAPCSAKRNFTSVHGCD